MCLRNGNFLTPAKGKESRKTFFVQCVYPRFHRPSQVIEAAEPARAVMF